MDVEILSEFQFNDEWVSLGIVTPESVERMKLDWTQGEDSNAEHYRWRAFSGFMAANGELMRAFFDDSMTSVLVIQIPRWAVQCR